ncbi:MAG: lipopolysaccharide kinase InaA family protein [Desulfobacterales bacterium]|jgi:tRNA A-37 threonylcarbamoyl transferase component Bud32
MTAPFEAADLRRLGRQLTAPFSLRLSSGEADGILVCTAILRHLPGKRLVCRAERRQGPPVIVKLFLAPRQARRHLARELEGLTAFRAVKIPTPALVGQTTLDDERTPLIMTTAIPDARNLAQCWPALVDRERDARLHQCVALIARLHEGGKYQRDIHPGNFLVTGSEIYLIDGSDVRPLGRVPRRATGRALTNLASFLVQFDPDADQWAANALQTYEAQRRWSPSARRLKRLGQMMRRSRHQRMRQRAAKVVRPCTAVAVRRSWQRYIACDRAWYSPAIEPLLNDPEAYMTKGVALKDGNSATVSRIAFEDQNLVIKRYNIKNRRHRLRRCLRPSRGRIAWCNAHMLRLIGIATPQPLALIEERWGPLYARAFLICTYQPGVHLADFWHHDWEAHDPRAAAMAPLGTLLARLAAARISHGDLKATNLIVHDGEITLVDLDGLRVFRRSRSFGRQFRKDCHRLLRNWQRHPTIYDALRQRLPHPELPGDN